MRLNRFESVRAYVASVKAEGVDLSRMNRKLIHYLASHVSARRVMSLGPEAFRLYLRPRRTGRSNSNSITDGTMARHCARSGGKVQRHAID